MKEKKTGKADKTLSASLRSGIIALVFLAIGFESALFYKKAAENWVLMNRDHPDTVFVAAGDDRLCGDELYIDGTRYGGSTKSGGSTRSGGHRPSSGDGYTVVARHDSDHSAKAEEIRRERPPRQVETFRFNPNTATLEELVRLGFSPAQAQSIMNYREKGGRFHRPSDFAKSYVVADSVFKRLEKYIDIPRLDLNYADSTALDDLPGIGPYFASKIVKHRQELGGFYCCKEQLLDIYHFDYDKLAAISDLVYVSRGPIVPFALWTLSEQELKAHPYIRSWQTAHSIVLYRQSMPRSAWTVDSLCVAGAISEDQKIRLRRLVIAEP